MFADISMYEKNVPKDIGIMNPKTSFDFLLYKVSIKGVKIDYLFNFFFQMLITFELLNVFS